MPLIGRKIEITHANFDRMVRDRCLLVDKTLFINEFDISQVDNGNFIKKHQRQHHCRHSTCYISEFEYGIITILINHTGNT